MLKGCCTWKNCTGLRGTCEFGLFLRDKKKFDIKFPMNFLYSSYVYNIIKKQIAARANFTYTVRAHQQDDKQVQIYH